MNEVDDTTTPAATVRALYNALSCRPGQPIDQDRVSALFIAAGRIQFAAAGAAGEQQLSAFSVAEFLARIAPLAERGGRAERELWHHVERFGNIAHVLSAYTLEFNDAQNQPVTRRGVNSVQLHLSAIGWRIVSLLWDVERSGALVPGQYLAD